MRGYIAIGFAICCILPTINYPSLADSTETANGDANARPMVIWTDRGPLTPTQVFFGMASMSADPLSRLPAPPFSHFETDDQANKFTPKCYLTDSNGVKWTLKFTDESHSDVAAPRLAWAL